MNCSVETFRDALGWAALGDPIGDDDGTDAATAMGDDILATPEMQAIRAFIANHIGQGEPRLDLPANVLGWVLA